MRADFVSVKIYYHWKPYGYLDTFEWKNSVQSVVPMEVYHSHAHYITTSRYSSLVNLHYALIYSDIIGCWRQAQISFTVIRKPMGASLLHSPWTANINSLYTQWTLWITCVTCCQRRGGLVFVTRRPVRK